MASASPYQTRMGVDRIYRALNAAIGNRYRGATGSSHSSYPIPSLPPSLSLSLSLSTSLYLSLPLSMSYRNPSFTFSSTYLRCSNHHFLFFFSSSPLFSILAISLDPAVAPDGLRSFLESAGIFQRVEISRRFRGESLGFILVTPFEIL